MSNIGRVIIYRNGDVRHVTQTKNNVINNFTFTIKSYEKVKTFCTPRLVYKLFVKDDLKTNEFITHIDGNKANVQITNLTIKSMKEIRQ